MPNFIRKNCAGQAYHCDNDYIDCQLCVGTASAIYGRYDHHAKGLTPTKPQYRFYFLKFKQSGLARLDNFDAYPYVYLEQAR